MVRTQIYLTEEQSRTLKLLAQEDNVSVAELVRRSVDCFIQERHGISKEERKQRLLSVIGIGNSGLTGIGANHDAYLADIYLEGTNPD